MVQLLGLLILLTGYACSTSHAATDSLERPAIPRQMVVSREGMSTDLDSIFHVAWSPDSTMFALLGTNGRPDPIYSVHIYEAMSRKVLRVLPIKERRGPTEGGVAFSPDGRYLAIGVGVITVWDTKTWQTVREIKGPYERGVVTDGIKSLAISPDSKSISVLYQALTWPETFVVRTHEEGEAIWRAEREIKRSGKFWEKLAKGEIRNFLDTVMTYDLATGTRAYAVAAKTPTPDQSQQFTGNLTYTSDGAYLIVPRVEYHHLKSGEHGRIRTFLELRDPGTGQLRKEIGGVHVMRITAQAVSPNAQFVATGTMTGAEETQLINRLTNEWDSIDNKDPIRLWDLSTGKLVQEFGPLPGFVKALSLNPDHTLLASCQTDIKNKETLWLWDVSSGQPVAHIKTPRSGSEVFGCAMSPNGKTVAIPVVGDIYLIRIQG